MSIPPLHMVMGGKAVMVKVTHCVKASVMIYSGCWHRLFTVHKHKQGSLLLGAQIDNVSGWWGSSSIPVTQQLLGRLLRFLVNNCTIHPAKLQCCAVSAHQASQEMSASKVKQFLARFLYCENANQCVSITGHCDLKEEEECYIAEPDTWWLWVEVDNRDKRLFNWPLLCLYLHEQKESQGEVDRAPWGGPLQQRLRLQRHRGIMALRAPLPAVQQGGKKLLHGVLWMKYSNCHSDDCVNTREDSIQQETNIKAQGSVILCSLYCQLILWKEKNLFSYFNVTQEWYTSILTMLSWVVWGDIGSWAKKVICIWVNLFVWTGIQYAVIHIYLLFGALWEHKWWMLLKQD